MAEKHVEYFIENSSPGSAGELMLDIFSFVSSSGQNAVRFAYDSTAASVSGSLGYGGNPTDPSNFPSGSFIVIEPVQAMPSGYRWQALFERYTSTTISVQLSTVGGWEGGSTKNFISNSTNNPPGIVPPVTDKVQWMPSAIAAKTALLISSCDLDTYGPNATPSTYFRVLLQVPSAAEASQYTLCVVVGGYIPFNHSMNTNPCCLISRIPKANAGSSVTFGFANPNANSTTKIAPDWDFRTKDLTSAYGAVAGISAFGTNFGEILWSKDPAGSMVNTPAFIVSYPGQAVTGYLGKHNMVVGYGARADGNCDANRKYLTVNDFMFRWNPSA